MEKFQKMALSAGRRMGGEELPHRRYGNDYLRLR